MSARYQAWYFTGTAWKRRGLADLPPYVPPPPPPPDPDPTPVTNPELPFELEPLRAAMSSAAMKAAPHAFVTFPTGGDGATSNTASWFTNRMPGGSVTETDGDSLLRDQPYDTATRPRANVGTTVFQVLDWADQVVYAHRAGFDGFFVDWLNLTDRHVQMLHVYDGAQYAVDHLGVPATFKIAAMIDGNTSIARDTNMDDLILKISQLAAHPRSWKMPDGRTLIPVYQPESVSTVDKNPTATQARDYFASLRSRLLAERGLSVFLWGCYQRGPWYGSTTDPLNTPIGQGYGAALDGVLDGHGRWGPRNRVEHLNPNNVNAGAAAFLRSSPVFTKKKWMGEMSIEDERPNQNKYEEAEGFANLRASAEATFNSQPDILQVPTWSDLAEHAHIQPSRNHGFAVVDLFAYYLAGIKLGFWPTITRDAIYLAHRVQPTAGYTEQVTVPDQVKSGSTAAADVVEAQVFLTTITDTTVRVTSGGVTTTFTPGAGNKAFGGAGVYAFTIPLRVGAVSAEIVRGGVTVSTVVSPFPVTLTPIKQDMHYRMTSSLRPTTGRATP